MADGGWIKSFRRSVGSLPWSSGDLFKLWHLCLYKASFDDRHITFNGMVVPLNRGQFVTGRTAMRDQMNDGVKPAQQVNSSFVWRGLKKFEKAGMLNISSNPKYSVITIVNWDKYQESEQLPNSYRTATEQQTDTNKNYKNEKNEKKSTLHRPAEAEPVVNYANVIAYLNKKSGKHFRDTETNRKLIRSRLNEGFSKDDIKTAIDHVVAGWKGTEMERYIQPSTIFRASKFEGYVNSVPRVFAEKPKGYGKPQRQEATPEWMQEGYQPPKQEVSADAKAKLARQLKELKQLRSRNATSS